MKKQLKSKLIEQIIKLGVVNPDVDVYEVEYNGKIVWGGSLYHDNGDQDLFIYNENKAEFEHVGYKQY